MRMPVVYIAGPFTAPNAWEVEKNIRAAEEMGMEVAKLGAMPLIQHTNTRFFNGTLTPDFWYRGTMALLERSDAVMALPNWSKSSGATNEVARARELVMWTFFDLLALGDWIRSWYGTWERNPLGKPLAK